MAKISLQFHGDPTELQELAATWAREFNLNMAVEQFFPDYRAIPVVDADLGTVPDSLKVRRVSFGLEPLDVGASSAHDFMARNPHSLTLTLETPTSEGLRQSALGAMTEDEESLRTWRRVIRKAKASMHKGASVVNPHSGARQQVKDHYYTDGAWRLARSGGIKMLAAAGWNRFEFNGPPDRAR
jgi:hypothetical protein